MVRLNLSQGTFKADEQLQRKRQTRTSYASIDPVASTSLLIIRDRGLHYLLAMESHRIECCYDLRVFANSPSRRDAIASQPQIVFEEIVVVQLVA